MNPRIRACEAVPEKPTDDQVATAMLSLEGDINNLVCMSRALANLLDSVFVEEGVRKDDIYTFRLASNEVEMLSFCWHNVLVRAEDIDRAFQAATDGRVVQ